MTNLATERKKHNWTLEYVAHETGVKKQSVHDWETGRKKPSYEALLKLENLFGKSHRELLQSVPQRELLEQSEEGGN